MKKAVRAKCSDMEREAVFSVLEDVARAIYSLFPGMCEVVIHDLTDLDSSTIHIVGDVTGRTIGSPMTDAGVRALQEGNLDQLLGYLTKTKDGRVLRCAAPFFKNKDGDYFAAMAINVDVTAFASVQRVVGGFLPSIDAQIEESFSTSLDELIVAKVKTAGSQIGKPLETMNRHDKMRLVNLLEQDGVFKWRNAVPAVAEILGVTRTTVYNYLKQNGSHNTQVKDEK